MRKKAEKFRDGLRHDIRMALGSHGGLSYLESLKQALDYEAGIPKGKQVVPTLTAPPPQLPQNGGNKRKLEEGQSSSGDKKPQPLKGGKQVLPSMKASYQAEFYSCTKCMKRHAGECRAGTNKCYHCGNSGHFTKHCPTRKAMKEAGQNNQGIHS